MGDTLKEFVEFGLDEKEASEVVYFLENYKYPNGIPNIRELVRPCDRLSGYGVVEILESTGVLSCPPTLSRDGKSIVYGWQKYLHRYGDYYYQVSATPSGLGPMETPNTRLDLLLHKVPTKQCKMVGGFVATLSALTVALRYYEKTLTLLSNQPQVFDEFLRNSWGEEARIDDVISRLSTWNLKYKPNLEYDTAVQAALVDGPGMYALVTYSNRRLTVLTQEARFKYVVYAFEIPAWLGDAYDRRYFYKAFIEFLLSYSGIRATYYAMYPSAGSPSAKNTLTYNIAERFSSFDSLVDYMVNSIVKIDGWVCPCVCFM